MDMLKYQNSFSCKLYYTVKNERRETKLRY